MKKISITNYELTADKIVAAVTADGTEFNYNIDREAYEHWLTDGTGEVDLSFTHSEGDTITEVPVFVPIAEYWQQGVEINNSPVLEHIHQFLTKDELSRDILKAEMLENRIKELISGMALSDRSEAYCALLEYGMMKKEVGERTAAVVFKKIMLDEQQFITTDREAA